MLHLYPHDRATTSLFIKAGMFSHGMAIPNFRVNGGNAGRGGEANNLNELRGKAAVGRGGCRAASNDDACVGCCAEEEDDGLEEEEDEAAEAEAAEAEAAEAEAAEAEAAEEEAAEAEAAEEEAAEAAAGTPAPRSSTSSPGSTGVPAASQHLRPPGLGPRHVPTPYLPPCI